MTTPQDPLPIEPETDQLSIILFSGDLDKALAAFIIANGAVAMDMKVTMFFAFWGMNVLRRHNPPTTQKDFLSKMFGGMMPRGAKKLKLSQMHLGGMGTSMMKWVMKKKNVYSLPDLIKSAREAGVRMVACSMSMDVMGFETEEFIDGVEVGGVATFIGAATQSKSSLFI